MTVFNWEGSGAPILGAGFKYYWAVTIPLTILVLTTWALGMFLPWKKWLIGGFWKPKDSQGRSEGRSEDV